jgi:hypothetical protein
VTCERAAVLGLGSRIACAEKAMVEDAHFAELGAAPATGVPRNAFSLSVRVTEKGKGRRHKADGNPFGVFDCGLWSAACINRPRQLFLYCTIVLRTLSSSFVVFEIRERST